MSSIRVLVVDDSAFLRRNLPRLLETDADIRVIGTAANGREAVEMTAKYRPDVVLLDVLMPVMDGLTALRRIMREAPTPVIIFSSTTYEGTRQTMEALSLGAVDFLAKPSGPVSLDVGKIRTELIQKVKAAHAAPGAKIPALSARFSKASSAMSVNTEKSAQKPFSAGAPRQHIELVAIAASTGGPPAIEFILENLPGDLPTGLLIVQHLAEGFSEVLAERLNAVSPLEIKVSGDYEEVRSGVGLLAPAGRHLTVKRIDGKIYTVLTREPADALHKPSADVLFFSVAKICAANACAVIMTGMGDDGARGIKQIREQGGITIAQDEATSLIFGMPKAAIEAGGIDIVSPLEKIPDQIIKALR